MPRNPDPDLSPWHLTMLRCPHCGQRLEQRFNLRSGRTHYERCTECPYHKNVKRAGIRERRRERQQTKRNQRKT